MIVLRGCTDSDLHSWVVKVNPITMRAVVVIDDEREIDLPGTLIWINPNAVVPDADAPIGSPEWAAAMEQLSTSKDN